MALRVHRLNGKLQAVEPNVPISFDDKHSFEISVQRGRVGLKDSDLERLLNHYIFGSLMAPLRGLSVTIHGESMSIDGILFKGVPIPFWMELSVELVDRSTIKLKPTDMRISEIPGLGLMDALDITLESILDVSDYPSVDVKKNSLFLSPIEMIPLPAVNGHLEDVALNGEKNEIVFELKSGKKTVTMKDFKISQKRVEGQNYMLFRKGYMRVGKIMLLEKSLQILDKSPAEDPFELFLDRYAEQLKDSRIRSLPETGLLVRMPDYSDV
jgi:hypothetical protein